MSDLRPVIEQEQILVLLGQHFSGPIINLEPLEGGQVARTFAFRSGEQDYILRLNSVDHMPISFAKEALLARTIASPQIPIPAVMQVGQWQHFYFAISHRVAGQMVTKLPVQEVEQLLPEVIAILYAIHQVDVRQQKNFGIFNEQGVGLYPDWRSYLRQVMEEEEWDYFGKWHHMFEDTFLERDFYEGLFERMVRLLDFCPPSINRGATRYLVHGNYSLRNILESEGKITGVVDWLDAQYGDFVYDIAGLDFWIPGLDMCERCQRYYQEREGTIPFYEERVLCYEYYTALSAMRFFAKKGDEQAYQWSRRRILELRPD
jgi:hygromycin-B 4-O-kinase